MVQETIAAPGTSAFALGTPSTGFVAFSTIPSITSGDTVDYLAIDASGAPWEVGTGTWTSGTLTRTTVLHNSSGGTTAVNFIGSTLVSNTLTAERYLADNVAAFTVDTVTATGSTQGSATAMTSNVTLITAQSGGNGVMLSASSPWQDIRNRSGAFVLIYPPSGEQIEGTVGVNLPVTLATGSNVTVARLTGGTTPMWYT